MNYKLSSRYNFVLFALTFLLLYACSNAEEEPDIQDPEEEEVYEGPHYAFPGAEGYGQLSSGGRGGKVYYVSKLTDDNSPGTLRHAINQAGARTILFSIGGTIELKSKLNISNGDLTIAGQSAPGGGITLKNYPVTVDADNIIIRYLRFRMGDEAGQEGDALGGRFHKNIIIDHCSMSWSTDECVSFYANENFTLQWCIISESLKNSVHGKGSHGYGGIWGGKYASFHHNLLAHHDSRNPRLGEEAGKAFALTDLVDLRNNVIYNWGNNAAYGGEAMNVNIVNCYYKPGPATPGGSKRNRIMSIDKNKNEGTEVFGVWGKFFVDGNVVHGSSEATGDNWKYGVFNQFHSSYGTLTAAEKEGIRMELAHQLEGYTVHTHTAEAAYELVMAEAGASLKRDAVDARIIANVQNADYSAPGSVGSTNGIIDSPSDVGGWPFLEPGTPVLDTDGDGMPDDWEEAHQLDPNSPTDGSTLKAGTPYTQLEVYLNGLVKDFPKN
ncbi:pectate lyase [Echinicola pacifica]|uniref:Pectate lyase n=1 Tax=Echinicola pacifica TaxID=346377 RepID=A0A918PP95_9BACT|nr:hypothetical protein [Echinicola pacifica]GGZ15749.1 pectate lyase [Echinicola pacifica]